MAIEVTDKDLYELLGRKDVEIFNGERVIANYQAAFEKVKELATEMDALKAAKTSLETSNGQLASKNVQLDQALTEARKESANSVTALANKSTETDLLRREKVELIRDLTQARDQLTKALADGTTLQYTCDDLQKEIDSLKTKKKPKP